MIFISNMKRFKNVQALSKYDNLKIIVTSNIITSEKNISVINYSSYLNEEDCISDNAGLMCINFLKKIGVTEILLAGFDGFSNNIEENYYEPNMYLNIEEEKLRLMNKAIAQKLNQLDNQINFKFLTKSVYKE